MSKKLSVLMALCCLGITTAHADGPPKPDVAKRINDVVVVAEDRISAKKQAVADAQAKLDGIKESLVEVKEKVAQKEKRADELDAQRSLFLVTMTLPSKRQRDNLVDRAEEAGIGPVMATETPNATGDYPVVIGVTTSKGAADARRKHVRSALEPTS